VSLSNLWRSRGVARWRRAKAVASNTTYSFLFRSRRRVSRDVRHSSYMSTARSGRESVLSTTFLILGLSLPIASSPTTSIAATVCSASVYLDILLLPIAIPNWKVCCRMGAQCGASGMFRGVAALASTHYHTGDRAWRAIKMPACARRVCCPRASSTSHCALRAKPKNSNSSFAFSVVSSQQNGISGAYRRPK
jgi:hypothetical protein